MSVKKDGAKALGVGAAACVACCAGPILGFLGSIGIATAAGALLFGVVGLVVALVVGALLYRRRRARAASCAPVPDTVMVAGPVVRRP